MAIDVYYTRSHQMRSEGLPSDRPALILIDDSWNDFGYELMVGVRLLLDGNLTHLGRSRFLFAGITESRTVFNKLPRIPDTDFARFQPGSHTFISLGSSLDYYKRLRRASRSRSLAEDVLTTINDVAVLSALRGPAVLRQFEKEPAFETALLRSLAERQALELAPSEILGIPRPSDNAKFSLVMALSGFLSEHVIPFDFTEALLPGDINVLIGLNGVGKTQALVHLVDYVLHLRRYRRRKKNNEPTLIPEPRFRKVIALSLSPYSVFPATAKVPERERTGYANIGFHTTDGSLSLSTLKRRRLEWLKRILAEDDDESIPDWRRLPVLFQMLERLKIDDLKIRYVDDEGSTTYQELVVNAPRLQRERRRKVLSGPRRRKLLFYRAGIEVRLSSGQEQLFLMVLSLLAELERESLVVIDEPELYLHPNLEIAFIGVLQELLDRFESIAILATHSNTIVRELPRTCVKVLRFGPGPVPLILEPEFQTFGADISELANRVFDNVYARQPFVEWLLRTFGSEPFAEIRRKYGDQLNDENLAILYAHERERTRGSESR